MFKAAKLVRIENWTVLKPAMWKSWSPGSEGTCEWSSCLPLWLTVAMHGRKIARNWFKEYCLPFTWIFFLPKIIENVTMNPRFRTSRWSGSNEIPGRELKSSELHETHAATICERFAALTTGKNFRTSPISRMAILQIGSVDCRILRSVWSAAFKLRRWEITVSSHLRSPEI